MHRGAERQRSAAGKEHADSDVVPARAETGRAAVAPAARIKRKGESRQSATGIAIKARRDGRSPSSHQVINAMTSG